MFDPLPPYEECEYRYSNAAFIAAALMLEKVTGKTWEELINILSENLQLGIHIGSPYTLGPDQPVGHIIPKYWGFESDQDLIPVKVELKQFHEFDEFLLLCAPAGDLSITSQGFLKFLQLNIDGINGGNNYLTSETYQQIFFSYPFYTVGWGDEPNEILRFSHRGSNMMFHSFAGISPDKELGVVIMMNMNNDEVLTKIIRHLLRAYSEK